MRALTDEVICLLNEATEPTRTTLDRLADRCEELLHSLANYVARPCQGLEGPRPLYGFIDGCQATGKCATAMKVHQSIVGRRR